MVVREAGQEEVGKGRMGEIGFQEIDEAIHIVFFYFSCAGDSAAGARLPTTIRTAVFKVTMASMTTT